MRIVIIGAGPCGLGAAHRLLEKGHGDFAVYERRPYVGGLAASFRDARGFTWDFAVHVAHSHYHYIDRLMAGLLPDGFYHHERRSWVREYQTFIPYPFQYNIRHLPAAARDECLAGLRELNTEHRTLNTSAPNNFEDWILAGFGRGIAKHFMIPYNRKIWSTEPRDMGYQWIGDRVPTLDLARVERNIAEGRDDVSWGPNHTFQFPKEGGTGAIWNALAARIPADRLHLSRGLVRLDPDRQLAFFEDGTEERYDALISTMPLVRLAGLVGDAALARRARQLRHTHVHVVGAAPSFPIPDSLRDKTWIYVPEEQHAFYRVTPFSIFSPAHVPDPTRTCSFLCEISHPGDAPMNYPDPAPATLRGLRESGLLEADPATAHLFHMREEFGYPVPTLDRDAILDDVLPALEQRNLYSRGRFGGWKYEAANMDHSVMQGVEVVDRLLEGVPEVTLPTPNVVNAGKR
ncbi:MAG: FAD-dependent oxidoreductase [Kiritimatiellae bacterium]|nr:FAD-dependent oxidoreductase [Kiritimatiellia bacterium]